MTSATTHIATDFTFSDQENRQATAILLQCESNPYRDYASFREDISNLTETLPSRFQVYCLDAAQRDMETSPLAVMTNCPIDVHLPIFGSIDPLQDKYTMKSTFVAEGFLESYAQLTGTSTLAHLTVNDGDFFHDIYPKESMYDKQSAKTLKTLKFHRDFPTHFVSPDFINTITLRDTPENDVKSTFAYTRETLATLSPSDIQILSEPRFHTPVDDSSGSSKKLSITSPTSHSVVIPGRCEVRIFEGRTRGLDEESQAALDVFVCALHAVKRTRISAPGDAVSFSNRHVVHGREVNAINDEASLRHRWLMKSHTVTDLESYGAHFLEDRYGVVNG
ncbi:hypothetical protein [Rhodococcus sp. IEGM 1330]|uniref:hypothetical protein n=1 Tax=Rhodococcus sp. IEGM 1330 TaxID=3082225 RepID=UPI002952F851|nr:hypothetical protein [Rhodococcus sp. IEGM 1330]MDV8022669.1 hypothetical protein [Rhodococcus sp. IEGM 1330]